MRMEYKFDFSRMPDYAVIKTSGVARVNDFATLIQALTQAPQWIAGTKQLIDHSALDLSQITPQDMDMICSLTSLFAKDLGNGRCAFVLQGISGLMTGEYYFHSSARLSHTTEVFTDVGEAENWLLKR